MAGSQARKPEFVSGIYIKWPLGPLGNQEKYGDKPEDSYGDMRMNFKPIASSSNGNAYVLEHEGEQILIEAGIPFKRVQEDLEWDTRRIRFCLISHSH